MSDYFKIVDGEEELPKPAIYDPLVWLAVAGAVYIVFVAPVAYRKLRAGE